MMEKTLTLFQDHEPTPLDHFKGACIAILGIRNSGKSNSAARLAEQFLMNRVPMAIVDILGEWWGLKEQHDIFVVGRSAHVDIEIHTPKQAAAVAVWSLEERMPIIIDVSDYDDDMRNQLLKAFFEQLWRTAGSLSRGYEIFLEEAHNWMPQGTMTPVKPILNRIAGEGRSRGLNIIMISQRSAKLDKNILTQANMLFLHRVAGRDLDVYQDLIPTTRKDRNFVDEVVPGMSAGQAVFVQEGTYKLVNVLKRETWHGGQTPSLDVDAEEPHPTLNHVPADRLESLRKLLASKTEDAPEDDPTLALEETIAALEQEIRDQDAEIESLRDQVSQLSKLVVTMPDNLTIQANMPYTPAPYGVAVGAMVAAAPTLEVALPAVDQATKRAIRLQEQRFETLLKDVKNMKWQMHRILLGYLLRRENLALTLPVLAQRNGYTQNTVVRNPPTPLIEMGLLQRNKIGVRVYEYTAKHTRAFLRKTYPDLDTDSLVERLLQICPE